MGKGSRRWRASCARLRLLAGLLALAAMACARRDVPETLLGYWTSSDPRYAGRALIIGPATIDFGGDPATDVSFIIERVETEKTRDGSTFHTVHYRDREGGALSVRLQLVPGGTPSLRFENHDDLWVRTSGAPESQRGGG